jgi:hypothetical protein
MVILYQFLPIFLFFYMVSGAGSPVSYSLEKKRIAYYIDLKQADSFKKLPAKAYVSGGMHMRKGFTPALKKQGKPFKGKRKKEGR